ncbi:unnamed protein product, partial [Staurois parvus]
MPPISTIISAHQCCLSVPISSTYQCSQISASSSMPTSAASSVQPISAHQFCLSVQLHQCSSV